MNKPSISTLQASILTIAAFTLVSCGGGGGADNAAGLVTTLASSTTTTQPSNSSIVLSVSSANYSDAERMNAYTYLNSQRQTCGFGLLQQNTNLDLAAQAHSNYMLTNGESLGHSEDPSAPGFTGVNVGARMTAAGYTFTNMTEVIAAEYHTYGTTYGQANIMSLFVAPFHGMAMLHSHRDIGVGHAVRPSGNGFPEFHIQTLDFGTTAARPSQLLPSNVLATYPCAGTTGVLSKSYASEIPTPIPNRDIRTQPIGHPIYLKVRDGQSLTLTSTDLRVDGGNTPVALLPLSRSNDHTGLITDDSFVTIMPDAPLAINTNYRFTASGANNGQAFSISFVFSTGAF